MKLLVTGGAGFMGSDFIGLMLEEGNELCCFDALTYAANLNALEALEKHQSFTFVKGDICDMTAVKNAVADYKPDIIVNFAAESHVDNSIKNPLLFQRTNVEGALVLLEACREFGLRFHQVSTDEVYGDTSLDSGFFFDENSALNPSNPYSATKAAADLLTLSYFKTYGVRAMVSRSCNNFGKYQNSEKFIPKIILCARANLPLPLYGDGENIRDWIPVREHSRAVKLVLEEGKPGEVYNITIQNHLSNNKVARRIISLLDSRSEIEYVADRMGHDRRYAMKNDKLRALGFLPKAVFEEKIKELL